jgi:hypothetical protein
MRRAVAALAWLEANGFTPTGYRGNRNSRSGAESSKAAPVCQYYGPMKPSKKSDGWYCPSKMGDGSYCRQQVKK